MAYEGVKQLARERLTEVQLLLNHLTSLEPQDAMTPHSSEVKILRGFFYVHLYAALEKSINETVQLTLRLISAHNIPAKCYEQNLSTIVVRGRLQSFKNCGYRSYNKNALAIFEALNASDATVIDESQFADVLMNVWMKSIIEVLDSFGIEFVADPKTRTTIDELVENRNKVAHGRESALVVGERHRSDVLRDKFVTITGLIDAIINKFEEFYCSRLFIKASERSAYLLSSTEHDMGQSRQ